MSATAQDDEDKQPPLAWMPQPQDTCERAAPLCWPFPPGSQNQTDKAVKLKPYVPPKRRSLNQY